MARRLRFSPLRLRRSVSCRIRSPASDGRCLSRHDTATPCATMCVFSCIFFYTCTACTRALRLLRARAQSVTSFGSLALLDELCSNYSLMPKLVAVRLAARRNSAVRPQDGNAWRTPIFAFAPNGDIKHRRRPWLARVPATASSTAHVVGRRISS